jgi:hypothetical protein
MRHSPLPPAERRQMIGHVLEALRSYWPDGQRHVASLPVRHIGFPVVKGPLRLVSITLPRWALETGVNGQMAVPGEACDGNQEATWEKVDWWLAAFLLLECWHERVWESAHGPIHSYSFRLKGWDEAVWQHAWVNRIALFLRAWAAKKAHTAQAALFGPMPTALFVLTHDVDAIKKTFPIRFKQGAFNALNAARALYAGNVADAVFNLKTAARFLLQSEDWWTLERLLKQEKELDIRSHLNFHADTRRKTPTRWFLDPGYCVGSNGVTAFMQGACREGWTIGLHPGFDSWRDSGRLRAQKRNLENHVGREVRTCRQHWLRFSWKYTWPAQQEAGLRLDTTLMFNDRPGFRSAAALQWNPWNGETGARLTLQALPTVLMDSHLYDYQRLSEEDRNGQLAGWVHEVRQVGGTAAFLWHPHTLTRSYGWQKGFDHLLGLLTGACREDTAKRGQ